EALAAAMGQRCGSFEQQQTVFRRRRKEPATARFLHEVFVVLRRLEAEQRKSKPVLAARFSVAPAAIAAGLGEDGNDLMRKIDRRDFVEMLDDDGQRRAQTVRAFRRDDGRTIT